jgi:hypothetical protein
MAAGSVAAVALPVQAAPIIVILPSPLDIRTPISLDIDQDGLTDIFFSGSGSTAFASVGGRGRVIALSGQVQPFSVGASFGLTGFGTANFATMPLGPTTVVSFLGLAFNSLNVSASRDRLAFFQFNGPLVYGYAWEQASTLTTFDLQQASTAVPEPATGALAALALGAAALAARKRKPV